jgi:hypothetical protein
MKTVRARFWPVSLNSRYQHLSFSKICQIANCQSVHRAIISIVLVSRSFQLVPV